MKETTNKKSGLLYNYHFGKKPSLISRHYCRFKIFFFCITCECGKRLIIFFWFCFLDQTGGANCEMTDKTSEAA